MDQLTETIFNSNPDIETLYFTSDGFAFFNENDARSHAAKLQDNQVDKIDKSIFESSDTTDETHLEP
jgi:hypothetical protein